MISLSAADYHRFGAAVGIVKDVLETEWRQILAVCLFLMAMAVLMVARVWLPPTFAGVDPEAQVSARMRQAP